MSDKKEKIDDVLDRSNPVDERTGAPEDVVYTIRLMNNGEASIEHTNPQRVSRAVNVRWLGELALIINVMEATVLQKDFEVMTQLQNMAPQGGTH